MRRFKAAAQYSEVHYIWTEASFEEYIHLPVTQSVNNITYYEDHAPHTATWGMINNGSYCWAKTETGWSTDSCSWVSVNNGPNDFVESYMDQYAHNACCGGISHENLAYGMGYNETFTGWCIHNGSWPAGWYFNCSYAKPW